MAKKISYILLLSLFLTVAFTGITPISAQQDNLVYIIQVEGIIDGGKAAFLNRAFNEAVANGATGIILEIDTPGGRIDSAVQMGKTILNSPVHTIAFVRGGAISAGVLLTISAQNVVMAPGSTIGAAEPRRGEQRADEKTLSFWTKQLEGAAEVRGRDKQLVAAMSDAEIEIPNVIEKGRVLTLTAEESLELGLADHIFSTRGEILQEYGFTGAKVVELKPGLAENIASLVTNPYVSPILLTIGFYGLLMEVYSAGWGVPGTMGLIALSLFFGGHLIAGFAGVEAIILFVLGVVLLAVEVFVTPGFGVAGVGGIAALIASILLASISMEQAFISLAVVFIGTILLFVLTFRFVTAGKFWRKLVLGDKLDAQSGFSSANTSLTNYLGREGITITPLRPAGTIEFDDGDRLDVVTEGNFIGAQVLVKIVKVEGSRILVREIKK